MWSGPEREPSETRLSRADATAGRPYSLYVPMTPSADEYLPLLRSQKNDAFRWVVQSGFDPRDFEVGNATWGDDAACTRFAYRDSAFFLDVSTVRGSFSLRHSPGSSEVLTHQMSLGSDFHAVERPFLAWLAYLRREVEAPDLWAMAQEGPTLFFVGGVATDNDPFTAPELAQIAAAVERTRVYLVENGVEGEALEDANRKLDYLVEVSRRSGRFDWANIAFSTAWGVAVAAAFDPDRARVLFEILAAPVRHLLSG
jgi:hypothetical protein